MNLSLCKTDILTFPLVVFIYYILLDILSRLFILYIIYIYIVCVYFAFKYDNKLSDKYWPVFFETRM